MDDPLACRERAPEGGLVVVQQRIDTDEPIARSHLDEAQLRIVGALAHELGIESNDVMGFEDRDRFL